MNVDRLVRMMPSTEEARGQIEEALAYPRNFMYTARREHPEMFETWGFVRATESRDSDLVDQSNAAWLRKALAERFGPPGRAQDGAVWREEESSHFLCGWVRQLAVKVVECACGHDVHEGVCDDCGCTACEREPTEVFRFVLAFEEYLRDVYPVADTYDLDAREDEALLGSIRSREHLLRPDIAILTEEERRAGETLSGRDAPDEYDYSGPPVETWPYMVARWLRNNEERETENLSGRGARPSDGSVRRAMRALNLLDPEEGQDV